MARRNDFFAVKNPQAVLKHGVLTRYAYYFAGRAGSGTGGRVAFIDGYAGEGRYKDGSPGSPLLLATEAERAGLLINRDVRLAFVESDARCRAELVRALAEYKVVADMIEARPFEEAAPDLLDRYSNHSILAFVDPFGLGVSHDSLVDILRQSRTGRPIDVLYHFSLSTVARMGSVGISPDADYAEQNAAHLDRVLGASVDWRGMFKGTPSSDGAATRTAIAVAHAFGASLQTTTGMRCTSIEVRQRPDQLPKYLLMLISRDPSGRAHWDFADVAASAHAEWLLHCDVSDFDANIAVRDNFGLLSLWDPERPTLDEIKRNLDAIADRDFDEHLRRLFRQRSSFRLVDDVAEAFGPMLGRVGHPAVRRAIRRLHSSGLIDDDGKGDFHTRTITWIG